MTLARITLLLIISITLTFVSAETVQNSPNNVTCQERMQEINSVVALPPRNQTISHFIASESPASSPGIAPSPGPVPSHSNLNGSDNVFDVRKNGAVGDGKTDDTKAFKASWDLACNSTNQTKILAPKGYSFLLNPTVFEGPCQNSVIFQVDGTMVAQEDHKSWPHTDSWLEFNRVDGLTMQGGGLIDGKGKNWWSCESCNRPVALRFGTCTNLKILGFEGSRLRVENSPQFHIVIDQDCQNVTVDSISIISPATSPNTDGIHIASKDIIIRNSNISNGDDCISMSNGSENIQIENVDCRDGHGISIGSLGKDKFSKETVKNINVTNCLITDSQNGVRIKTWASGSGLVSNVNFKHIQMNAVSNPIIIDQFYCPNKKCSNNGNSKLLISDVTFSNITGTYNSEKPAVHLKCSDTTPCTNITIVGVHLLPAEGKREPSPISENASGCLGEKIQPPVTGLQKGSSQFVNSLLKKGIKCINR